jgi:hypothetical protein
VSCKYLPFINSPSFMGFRCGVIEVTFAIEIQAFTMNHALPSQAQVQQVVIQPLGNKAEEEPFVPVSESPHAGAEVLDWLSHSVSKVFERSGERYAFSHENSLEFHEVFQLSKRYLEGQTDFLSWSVEVARHLYQCSDHPRIGAGELICADISQLVYNNFRCPALLLYKIDKKTPFMAYQSALGKSEVLVREGIHATTPEKAALIIKTHPEKDEFEVLIVDKAARGGEAAFWKNDFLQVVPIDNAYLQTQQFLQTTRQYFVNQFEKDFEAERPDAIDLMNRSYQFFKENEQFDRETFEEKVFQDTRLVAAFKTYDSQIKEEGQPGIPEPSQFDIHPDAVKKQNRVFKSVIKLDKNFHLYIHGNRDWVEKGVDPETGRKFYKLYYESES